MTLRFSIDRFEDDIAVFVAEDGHQIRFPRDILPEGVKAGEILSITIGWGTRATRAPDEATGNVREILKS